MLLDVEPAAGASSGIWDSMACLWREGGVRRLYAGILPRTLSIGIGGFIFFGAYEKTKSLAINSISY
jgi:solute carrier family 25 S-adenosylmethionine transporter 26